MLGLQKHLVSESSAEWLPFRGIVTVQRQILIGLVITFCWDLSGTVAEAQQTASAEPSPAPTPIPLSEIASHEESTLDLFKASRRHCRQTE